MIFLTGASGLIGSHICRRLVAEGFAVRALHRPGSSLGALKDIAQAIDWVEGDLLDVSLLRKALEGCQQVVHCAGVVSYSPRDTELLYQVNVEGTKALVDASLAAGIKRFVHLSSVAAIGRPKRQGLIDEEQKWEKSPLNSWYGETKYLGELEVWRGHTEGMPAIIFNPAVVLGPGPVDHSSTQLFGYILAKKPFYPPGLVNWVDIRDLGKVLIGALQPAARTGERYIVSAGAVRYELLFRQMADCLGVQPPQYQTNSVLTTGAYYLEKIKGLFGKKEQLITKETTILSSLEIEFNNSKITNHYDISFRPLTETLPWCCHELQTHLR
jgi:dihydroflavonol-4-reductase